MIQMMRALGATAVVVASCMGSPAVAQTKQLTLCWAAWDPANALVELSKDFTAKTGIKMKFEFVPWTNYADRLLNELNSQGQAVRPDHRRQPVDRRRRRERPVRQAQRFLRQGRHHDGRLHAGDRGRLFRVAQEHAELLGAAGDGRRGRLDLSQGLVRAAGDAGRVQEEVRPRPRPAQDLGRTQAGRRVLPGPRDRRQEGLRRLRSIPSAAPKASPWA